jgi:hypothetical protein
MEEVKTKKCACCGEVKPATEFSPSKQNKDGLMFNCKLCRNAKSRANHKKETRYEKNKEVNRERKRLWSIANPEKKKEQRRNSWKKNKKTYVAYVKANKSRYAAYCAKRRATVLLRTPKWLSVEQLKEIETEYALREWCSKVMGEEYHVDHIVPLQGKKVSGLHVPWNLRVIPATENRSKSNNFNPEEGMSMPAM